MNGNRQIQPRGRLRVGVHTPVQHTSVADLRALWHWVEAAQLPSGDAAFDWISVWDHFGSLTGTTHNLEAVSAHTALACTTSRVRCGCLVYSAGYRAPLQLASAIASIDHWSGGRAVLGLGAGYLEHEYRAMGQQMPSPAARARHLTVTFDAVRQLLDGHTVSVHTDSITLDAATCAPTPVQTHLPIFVGGGGEQVTIPLAARSADGWNIPMAAPNDAARKITLLRDHEQRAGRPPGSVEASVNIGLCTDEAALPARFGPRWEALRPAICTGSTDEMVDLVGRYTDAGVNRLLLSLRGPYDGGVIHDLQRFVNEIAPQLT